MAGIPVTAAGFLVRRPSGWFLVIPLRGRLLKMVPEAAKRRVAASKRKAPKRRNVAKGGR